MQVMLVYPPYVSPWSPYLGPAALGAYLRRHGKGDEIEIRDLNLEFFDYATSAHDAAGPSGSSCAPSVDWARVASAKHRIRSGLLDAEDDEALVTAFGHLDAAVRATTGGAEGTRLWRVDAAGGEPEVVGLELEAIHHLRLHPDGRRLAFTAGRVSQELWVMTDFLPGSR